MSRPVVLERQNPCLALSRSVLDTKIVLWPESGYNINLAQSGHKFSYGTVCCKLNPVNTVCCKMIPVNTVCCYMNPVNTVCCKMIPVNRVCCYMNPVNTVCCYMIPVNTVCCKMIPVNTVCCYVNPVNTVCCYMNPVNTVCCKMIPVNTVCCYMNPVNVLHSTQSRTGTTTKLQWQHVFSSILVLFSFSPTRGIFDPIIISNLGLGPVPHVLLITHSPPTEMSSRHYNRKYKTKKNNG